MTYRRKAIDITFTLDAVKNNDTGKTYQPTFAGGNNNQKTLSGYRVIASVTQPGGNLGQDSAMVRIFGMSMSDMNTLSTLGTTPTLAPNNKIVIQTGEILENGDKGPMSTIYVGRIAQAYTDLAGAPEGSFIVQAFSLSYIAELTLPPTNGVGTVNAVDLIRGIASKVGFGFRCNPTNLNVPIQDPYFPGSALTQIRDIVRAANIEWNNGALGAISLWQRGGTEKGNPIEIGPSNGLIGYPAPSGEGLMQIRTTHNSELGFGQQVKVTSSIQKACGTWKAISVTHDVEAEVPNGQWATTMVLAPPLYPGNGVKFG